MSTHIGSNVAAIEGIWLEPLPAGKPIKKATIFRLDRQVLVISEKGTIYQHGLTDRVYYSFGSGTRVNRVVEMLFKLGQITKSDRDAHIRGAEKRRQQSKARYAAESVLENFKDAGIRLTKAQRAKLEALSPPKPNKASDL